MLSLTVDTKGQLKVGVVTVHSLCVACFTTHNRKMASQYYAFQNLKGASPNAELVREVDEPVNNL